MKTDQDGHRYVQFLVALGALFWLALVAANWAEASEAPEVESPNVESNDVGSSDGGMNSEPNREPSSGRDGEDNEYNFSWLDPEKKIYVLQNRKYNKGGHVLLSLMGGVGASNPYRNSYNFDPRIAYYFNETFGIEAFYTMTSNSENSTYEALSVAGSNALPKIREIRSQYGALLHYVPWYAKINVFNSILYFDWYFSAGAGTIQSFVDTKTRSSDASVYVQQDLLGIFLGTGHQYHLSQHFLVRLDVMAALYKAQVNGTLGDTSWYTNYNFGLGIGWKL